MKIRNVRMLGIAMIAALAATVATAQAPAAWTGPDVSRVPGKDDIDFGLAEVCFPWLTGTATVEEIGKHQKVKLAKSAKGGVFTVNKTIIVSVAEISADMRMCSAMAVDGDAAKLFEQAQARLATWPGGLAPARTQLVLQGFIAKQYLCGPPAGKQVTAEIAAGSGNGKAKQDGIGVNMQSSSNRPPRCDNVITGPG